MLNFEFKDGTSPLACDFAAISKVYGDPVESVNRRYLVDSTYSTPTELASAQATIGGWLTEKPGNLRWLYYRIATATGVA